MVDTYAKVKAFIESFPSIESWNEFCMKIKAYELQDMTPNHWDTLLNSSGARDFFGYTPFKEIERHSQERINKLKFLLNVVPYGAGSSFIGALQSALLSKHGLNTGKRYMNLWDDQYGVTMLLPEESVPDRQIRADFVPDVTRAEEMTKGLQGGNNTWYQIYSEYFKTVNDCLIQNRQQFNSFDKILIEQTVHDYLIMFELMIDCKINLLVDCDKDRFQWCWLLSTAKHGKDAFRRWVDKPNVQMPGFEASRCKQSWDLYKIVKQYIPSMWRLNYEKFFVQQERDTVYSFIHKTLKLSHPTEEQIKFVQEQLKIYHNENEKIIAGLPLDKWRRECVV